MKPSEIKALFPISVSITTEMIEKSIYADRNNDIGATALKSKLPEELHGSVDWGTGIGRVDGVPIRSFTKNGKGKLEQYYPQASTTKVGDLIEFIVDNERK